MHDLLSILGCRDAGCWRSSLLAPLLAELLQVRWRDRAGADEEDASSSVVADFSAGFCRCEADLGDATGAAVEVAAAAAAAAASDFAVGLVEDEDEDAEGVEAADEEGESESLPPPPPPLPF